MDIVFLDKDGTLGRFEGNGKGLFPNTPKFIERQRERGRKLYVLTSAGLAGAKHLSKLSLDGYFGREKANSSNFDLYVLPDGTVRKIQDDYGFRIDFESESKRKSLDQESRERADRMFALEYNSSERRELQDKINAFFSFWHGLVHKETQEPFDEATRYQNPYGRGYFFKDVYLVRRLVSPQEYDKLRTAMVGDEGDSSTVISDPETPLIIISDLVVSGNWGLVEKILDILFSDNDKAWENFERLYSSSRHREQETGGILNLSGTEYTIFKGEHGERIIRCPWSGNRY